MKNKDLIVSLIQQDLKHHQLIASLENLIAVGKEKHHLELLNVVQELMDVPESAELVPTAIGRGKTYSKYMGLASWYPLESTSDGLRNQAEMCYSHLEAIIDIERTYLPKE